MSGLLLGIVCQFVLVDSTIWLPCLLDLFLLILAHVHTSVFCPVYPLLLLLLLLLFGRHSRVYVTPVPY